MKRAIDILSGSGGDPKEVEKAVRMHMDCPSCKGGGGNCYYPEHPCDRCGFTFADSLGVENVVALIEAMNDAKKLQKNKTV